MKTVGVREAQHNLARILRGKVPVARIVPAGVGGGAEVTVDWSDHAARMAAILGSAPAERVDHVLNDLRSGD